MTTTVLNTKTSKFENKISNHYKYIPNPEFNKLAAEIQEKLNSLITKDCNFFLNRIYFTSIDWSQNTFVYQTTFDTLKLKKNKATDYVLKLSHNILLSNMAWKPLNKEME